MPRRPAQPALAPVLAACAALAALSLLLPYEPVFDPWAWLVWGREGFGLDTSGGPSWKPLPVLVAWPLSAAGEAAPELWLLVARTGWLLCPVLAFLLARRIALRFPRASARPRADLTAGAFAAAAMVLLGDPQTPWLRQFAGGLAEPLMLGLLLLATELHLRGRRRVVLALLLAAGLIRPEAWIPLALYAGWLARAEPRFRAVAALSLLAVPVLWFVPDLLASGSPLTGAERAAVPAGGIGRLPGALWEGLTMAPLALLPAAAWALWDARRRRDRAIEVPAALALTWLGTVAVLTLAGFAGLARFGVPFAAAVAILGSVGLVELWLRSARGPAVALAVATVVLLGVRIERAPGDLAAADRFAGEVERVFSVVDAAGRERLAACRPIATTDLLTETALAWRLDVPLAAVGYRSVEPTAGWVLVDEGASREVRSAVAGLSPIAAEDDYALYAVSCPKASSSARPAAEAGVEGASR